MPRRVIGGSLVTAIALVTFACSGDSTRTTVSPSPLGSMNISDIATSATAGGAPGDRRDGSAPLSNGGPEITVTGNETVVNGGTLAVTVRGVAPFDRVYMFIGGRTLGLVGEFGGGIDGYYELALPSAQTEATALLTFPQEIPLEEFDLRFAVRSPSGAIGPYVGLTARVTRVGTGDVQVTLSWDADSDVDLHVVGPGGDEIYYGRRESPSGGELDLDSNAGCTIDGVRNENITWPIGRAPRGQYTVRVDYWDSCGVNRTNYTVRVNNGGNVQLVNGFFTGSGDQGGPGSGRIVATFERSSGPTTIVSDLLMPAVSPYLFKKPATQPARR